MPATAEPLPVLIVGAGPTGLATACALGVEGVPFLLLEKADAPLDEAREVLLYPAAQPPLERWRCLDAVRAASLEIPTLRVHRGPAIETVALDPPLLACPQPAVIRALQTRAAAFPLGRLRFGVEVIRVQQDDDGVEVDVRLGSTMDVETLLGACLVACDGSHSFVRRRLRLTPEAAPNDDAYVVADVPRDTPTAPALEAYVGDAVSSQIPLPDGRDRWILMLGSDEDGQPLSRPEALTAFLAARLGADAPVVEGVLAFRYFSLHGRVGHCWRADRVFLAGGAAHTLNPLWGQQLTASLQDADDLGRRLSRLFRGEEADLDGYEAARRSDALGTVEPQGSANLLAALRQGRPLDELARKWTLANR